MDKPDKVEDLKTIQIGSKAEVEDFSRTVKEFYENEALPFFAEFVDFKRLSDWLEININHKDLLVVNRNLQMIRALVTYKEADSDKFFDLYKSYYSFLQEHSLESPYKDMYETFIKFRMYFEQRK